MLRRSPWILCAANAGTGPKVTLASTDVREVGAMAVSRGASAVNAGADKVRGHLQENAPKYKRWWSIVKEGARHFYHGSRLFVQNTRLAWKYSKRLESGVALTRRERILLERATVDLMRLVPFSFFIILPGGEALLPIALKAFPGIIPSTFETQEQGRNQAVANSMKAMKARKVKLQYMRNVLETQSPKHLELMRRIETGDKIKAEDIRGVGLLCRKSGPFGVYQLPQDVLIALSQHIGVHRAYHKFMPKSYAVPQLQKSIREHYWKLKEDDQVLQREGLSDLTFDELQKACQQRGMRWADTESVLLKQLEWWVSLSTDPRVPYNTLFWIKPTGRSIRKSMMALPPDQRRELLGIINIPEKMRDQLDSIIDKVDNHKDGELFDDASADDVAAKADAVADDGSRASMELDTANKPVKEAIARLLGDDSRLTDLYDEVLEAEGKVTNQTMIEYIATDIHHSSHVVSNLFDELEMGEGSRVMTVGRLRTLVNRCKESS